MRSPSGNHRRMTKPRKPTPKQEAFARAVASGKSLADAYRAAYSTAKMKPATVRNNAHQLMKRSDISAIVEKYRKEIERKTIEAAVWTKTDASNALKWLMDICKESIELSYMTNNKVDNSARRGYTDAIAELNRINRVDSQGDTDGDVNIIIDIEKPEDL